MGLLTAANLAAVPTASGGGASFAVVFALLIGMVFHGALFVLLMRANRIAAQLTRWYGLIVGGVAAVAGMLQLGIGDAQAITTVLVALPFAGLYALLSDTRARSHYGG